LTVFALHIPGRQRVVAGVVGALGLVLPALSAACGACDEDKVAATYDHAAVSRAAAAGDIVVFCRINGRFDGARLLSATRRIPGVRQASVRVSTEFRALSFAVDAKQRTTWRTVEAVQRSLGPNASLTVLRLIPALRTAAPW
jgi:hypothetical protein